MCHLELAVPIANIFLEVSYPKGSYVFPSFSMVNLSPTKRDQFVRLFQLAEVPLFLKFFRFLFVIC
jgi:hypothetical protein